ncbi:unnamed protein product [Effrenium voratum]|nr:unnamed protein product [Effrenium voratum]
MDCDSHLESSQEAYWPFPWPRNDIDGGRQSPFEDEDDYDYDSCCGPEGQWKPPADLLLPGSAAKAETTAIVASSMVDDQDMGSHCALDSFIVNGEVIGETALGLSNLRGYKRRSAASSPGPASRKPRTSLNMAVPFVFGR